MMYRIARQLQHIKPFYRYASTQANRWNVVIGLEIHAQLESKNKLFSNAPTIYTDQPNIHVSVVDAAFPGTLPYLNPECIDLAVRLGLALNANIQTRSTFDRKHYFYHDIPAGYQITQHYEPIAKGGYLVLSKLDGLSYEHKVGLEQIQLEQDTGKSILDISGTRVAVDLNRAGMPLVEIVTRPDIRSSLEAGIFVRKIQSLLRAIHVSNGNMEEGSLRCDVNVSVNQPGQPFGTRCELKNLTSIRFLTAAIDAEVERQIALLESGKPVIRETRGYDVTEGKTFSLRDKETAVDYRFMPDPDLPPVYLSSSYIEQHKIQLPELPDARKQRFMNTYQLSSEECNTLFSNPNMDTFYEQISHGHDPHLAFHWLTTELLGRLKVQHIAFEENPVSVEQMRSILAAIQQGHISGKIAKKVLQVMIEGDQRLADEIVEAHGWSQISDQAVIDELCRKLVADHPDKVEKVIGGNKRLFGWFVGQIMQQTKGKANPAIVNQCLRAHMGLEK